jgi:hypothetical protein
MKHKPNGMAKEKYICAYCDKTFTDSNDARKKHFRGRAHKMNVKMWYINIESSNMQAISSSTPWTPVGQQTIQPTLPPSLYPAPPSAFMPHMPLAEWG